MHPDFQEFIERLEPNFRELLNMKPVTPKSLPQDLPKRAIYLFSEREEHRYVGRTNRLRERLRDHWAPSALHNAATFAFRMARENTGNSKATYTKKGSRAALAKDDMFVRAFSESKARIANMDLRFVEESNPVRQALLEIYVATVLKTQYNDFENH